MQPCDTPNSPETRGKSRLVIINLTVMDHACLNRIIWASEFAPRFRHSLFGVLHRCIDRVYLGHSPKSDQISVSQNWVSEDLP